MGSSSSDTISISAISDDITDTWNGALILMNDNDIDTFMATATSTPTTRVEPLPLPITQRTRYQALIALVAIITAADNGLQFKSMPVAETLLSLVVSISIVSGATDAIERLTSNNVPTYTIHGERFDQRTFSGRFCKMLLACDPRLLLYTEEEIQNYKVMAYDRYEDLLLQSDNDDDDNDDSSTNTSSKQETSRLLWEARRKADSALHTETKEWIPRPFRMSGYLPFNGPICIAMVASTSTIPLLIWSFFNQSQNALINHFNGPARSVEEMEEENTIVNEESHTTTKLDATLMKSYVVAVVSALSVTFGLSSYIQSHYSGEEATQLIHFISFPSAVIASSLNCYIVRQPEIDVGVPLLNEHMENVLPGKTSSLAAKRGVLFTTSTRAVLQMPTYFIPPLLLETDLTPLKDYITVENPSLTVPITTFLLLISFGIGLPMTVALFPQRASIGTEDVEERYQNLGYDEFYYNKGL